MEETRLIDDVECKYCGYKLPKGYKILVENDCVYCSEECVEKDGKAKVHNND